MLCKLLPSGEQYDCDLLGTSALVPRICPCLCAADCQSFWRVGVHDVEAGGRSPGDSRGIAGHCDLRHGIHELFPVFIGAQLSEYSAPLIIRVERERAACLLTVTEELHSYRRGAQPVLVVPVTPLLCDVHIDKPVIKAVVRAQQNMICVMCAALFIRPRRLIVILTIVPLTVLCVIVCDVIVGIAVAVSFGVVCRIADHTLAERVFCHCAVSEERKVRPYITPVVIGAERLAVFAAGHPDAAAPQLYLHRNALVLRGGICPVSYGSDSSEELGIVSYSQACRV